MRKILFPLFVSFLLLAGGLTAHAQTERYNITESGWGRTETGYTKVSLTPYEAAISELDIHRWRKTKGEVVVDFDERELTVRLPRKEINYVLLTESYTHRIRGGWDYVDYLALENGTTLCRVWICTHETGAKQVCVLFNNFVQGYRIEAAE